MKKNILLTLEYDGTRYDGWQKQGNTGDTIQAKLEAVLSKWAKEPIEVAGSGRTDAGVHAICQTANFHMDTSVFGTVGAVKDYLNRYLPEDIRVLSAGEVPERFHSRLSAVGKTYAYYVETGDKKQVFERKYVYGLGETLNLEQMREAATFLIGEHDFKSFCANKRMKKSTVRRIDSIEICEEGTKLVFRYKGNGFLYRMVRIITGTLIEVGQGKRSPQDMKTVLASCNRENAGPAVPPKGLFLISVDY